MTENETIIERSIETQDRRFIDLVLVCQGAPSTFEEAIAYCLGEKHLPSPVPVDPGKPAMTPCIAYANFLRPGRATHVVATNKAGNLLGVAKLTSHVNVKVGESFTLAPITFLFSW